MTDPDVVTITSVRDQPPPRMTYEEMREQLFVLGMRDCRDEYHPSRTGGFRSCCWSAGLDRVEPFVVHFYRPPPRFRWRVPARLLALLPGRSR